MKKRIQSLDEFINEGAKNLIEKKTAKGSYSSIERSLNLLENIADMIKKDPTGDIEKIPDMIKKHTKDLRRVLNIKK